MKSTKGGRGLGQNQGRTYWSMSTITSLPSADATAQHQRRHGGRLRTSAFLQSCFLPAAICVRVNAVIMWAGSTPPCCRTWRIICTHAPAVAEAGRTVAADLDSHAAVHGQPPLRAPIPERLAQASIQAAHADAPCSRARLQRSVSPGSSLRWPLPRSARSMGGRRWHLHLHCQHLTVLRPLHKALVQILHLPGAYMEATSCTHKQWLQACLNPEHKPQHAAGSKASMTVTDRACRMAQGQCNPAVSFADKC